MRTTHLTIKYMPTQFEQTCYILLKKVPSGKVTTYKEIAKALGKKGQIYRAIGRAMANNPFAPKVPCHRVVLSSGEVGNYSAEGGIKRKIELLKEEGIIIKNNKIKNFEKVLHKF